VLFVFHSFRPEHPLLDLRLFKNRNLTVSIITMFLFAAAFFGGLLAGADLLPGGPRGVDAHGRAPRRTPGHRRDDHDADRGAPRWTSTRSAGSCRSGWILILIGMFGLTQLTATTPYPVIIAELFVMGLGMGATMMPLFTSALKTLEVSRGRPRVHAAEHHATDSQLGGGRDHVRAADQPPPVLPARRPAMAVAGHPALAEKIPAAAIAKGLEDAAQAFAETYWVAG
jgi:hypothetical protein